MIYKNEETNPIKLLWVESLMIWGEELVDSNLNWNRYNSLLSNIKNEIREAHPYIRARIFGVGLLNNRWNTFCNSEIQRELISEGIDLKIDASHDISFSFLVFQYLLYTDSKDLILRVKNNMDTYIKSEKVNILDSGIPFILKLITSFLNESSTLQITEIDRYQTKFTNEDELLKAMALKYIA